MFHRLLYQTFSRCLDFCLWLLNRVLLDAEEIKPWNDIIYLCQRVLLTQKFKHFEEKIELTEWKSFRIIWTRAKIQKPLATTQGQHLGFENVSPIRRLFKRTKLIPLRNLTKHRNRSAGCRCKLGVRADKRVTAEPDVLLVTPLSVLRFRINPKFCKSITVVLQTRQDFV